MKIVYRDGLLYTTLEIRHMGRRKMIDNVVIDTGAARTILSPDAVIDVGIKYGLGDRIVGAYGIGGMQYAFEKKVDTVKFGSFVIQNCTIDFGLIDEHGTVNGLLGLDLLVEAEVVIDFKNMLVHEAV